MNIKFACADQWGLVFYDTVGKVEFRLISYEHGYVVIQPTFGGTIEKMAKLIENGFMMAKNVYGIKKIVLFFNDATIEITEDNATYPKIVSEWKQKVAEQKKKAPAEIVFGV